LKKTKIVSWNVNGIRAAQGKGFLDWLNRETPDILCLQETKARPEQLAPELMKPIGYETYWNYPEKKGYSGVATYSRRVPLTVSYGLGDTMLDTEGRVIETEHEDFTLLNIYFPNGKKDALRLKYKMDFYDAFLVYADGLKAQGKKLIICGDFNTAHKEIDLARPKENEKISGFLPEERAWLDKFISHGYADTLRHLHDEPAKYSWWDYKTRARERNIGWRIDYFFVSEDLLPNVKGAFISPNVMGSDHCPVGIILA